MFNQHLAGDVFAGIVTDEKKRVKEAEAAKRKARTTPVMDSAEEEGGAGSDYVANDVALKAAAMLQEWAEADDMDEGETLATRLSSMMIGIADADLDGEIGDDEMAVLEMALESAWDYLAAKGVEDGEISSLLNDWDEEAATRIQELLASRLPDGDEAAADDMNSFVFGDGSDEAVMDATYKMKVAIRGGKKMRIKKRVAGTVRLSAKQKMAIRKAVRKSHSASAQMHRAKSMRVRKSAGM